MNQILKTLVFRFKIFFGLFDHDRKLFLVGNIALVKCTQCGAESIPWYVTQENAERARSHHQNDLNEIVEINRRVSIEKGYCSSKW